MAVVLSIASPSVLWRSLARPRMDAMVPCEGSDPSWKWYPSGWDKEFKRERAMACAREAEV